MLEVLRQPTYSKLFAAQVVALVGTGLLTVALGLLAFDLAGADAGLVLGTALTIKMLAYVGLAPVVAAITHAVPRRALLVMADFVRASVAVSLPFVDQTWQIYLLIFVLQAASATFTPAFQAVIPDVLPDERHYTRALSLSRLAYDLEAIVSPGLAAALLTMVSYHQLFVGTVIGFLASAALVLNTRLPPRGAEPPAAFMERLTRGVRLFSRLPELRALLAMNLAVACATAMVLVNTVVLVQADLDRPQTDVAILLAAYGAGSMAVALLLPRLLDNRSDRTPMLLGTAVLPLGLLLLAAVLAFTANPWTMLLAIWFLIGAATSMILTPSARLLRRNSTETNRPAVFAAQFSLSHACFMLTYPLAGGLGAAFGLAAITLVLAGLALLATIGARSLWRSPIRAADLTLPRSRTD